MAEYVNESDMVFGPFSAETFIRIESIPQYVKIQDKMHMSEFIQYDSEKKRLISLEAKKSAPNPGSEQVENPREKFEEYIHDIKEKFLNSLDLYVNMALKKEVPTGFLEIDYNQLDIVFILVIKNHEKAWLKDVNDALQMQIKSELRASKMWKCKVVVINEIMAKSSGLIAI